MARTIEEIQTGIINSLTSALNAAGIQLSSSAVAEWRMWTYVVAVAIQAFEVVLDAFKQEINVIINKITPGTERWYVEMSKRFQNGYELTFDTNTAMYYYETEDTQAQIIKAASVSAKDGIITLKVAKIDSSGSIIPLTPDEKYNFSNYMDAVGFAGDEIRIVSTTEDKARYNIDVYFDPAVPSTTVQEAVLAALDAFKLNFGTDSRLYAGRLVDVVMDSHGVMTCKLNSLQVKGTSASDFTDVDVVAELESGYFEYTSDSVLTLRSIKELTL